ncbi:MAG: DUF5715 family protein [Muribaculaceae bacterium]|nr:DUF5715 family protein [Muribaculaceae bacterium]
MRKLGKILIYTTISLASIGMSMGIASCSGSNEDNTEELEEIMGMAGAKSDVHKYYTDPLGYTMDNTVHKPLKGKNIPSGPRHHDRVHVNNIGPLKEVFNDSNKFQLEWAEKLGIEPISSLKDAYRTNRPLIRITDCQAYGVDNLTHSVPYLVPEAADLLKTIGYNFIDSLANRGVDGYKIKVTSLLRTPATVKSLKRVNKNATENSAHQYGTTFDISWSKFICADPTRTIDEGDLKNILAEVLEDLHKQKRCMVKFEKKTACFHITVTKPK